MCFGDKKQARTGTPPPRPMAQRPTQVTAPARVSQPPMAKLTKARPLAPGSDNSSIEITWPLDRPDDDLPTRLLSPLPPTPSPVDEIYSPRPYRYDDSSVPPSNVPSLYSLSDSTPSTPTDYDGISPYYTSATPSYYESHSPFEFPIPPSPPPMCPPTPSSMGESVRQASLMPAPLIMTPRALPMRMRRATTPPAPRLNIPPPPVPAVPVDLPRNTSPSFKHSPLRSAPTPSSPSPTKGALKSPTSPTKSSKSSKSSSKSSARSAKSAKSKPPVAPSRAASMSVAAMRKQLQPTQPTPERVAALALQRARTLGSSMRPKFSLPETLAPFSMPPPPRVMDLYERPTPPRAARPPPVVPERTGPIERVLSPGRIAIVDEEPYFGANVDLRPASPVEKVRLFPIPDSIIHGEARYQAERRRAGSNEGSRTSADAFDSRCPSPIPSFRPASVGPIGHQLPSRFSMSSLGSTLRVHQQVFHDPIARPASARPATRTGSDGGMPTFPSRHEAKKARKNWLAEQEEAKRQSAKMGVEGILGWDATTRRWVNKMTDEEKEAWLAHWKEKRSAQQALQRGSERGSTHSRRGPSLSGWDGHARPVMI